MYTFVYVKIFSQIWNEPHFNSTLYNFATKDTTPPIIVCASEQSVTKYYFVYETNIL